jgi:hypothetical protein
MEELDVIGSDVLTELFENVVDETPEIEVPAEEIPAEETPSLEETPGEETPPVEPEKVEPEKADSDKEVSADEVPEGSVPIPVHVAARQKAKETERGLRDQLTASKVARARAEAKAELLEEMANKAQQTPPLPPEKSPLEKFEEDYPGEAVTATVLLDQRKFDNAQTEQQSVQTRTQTQGQLVDEGIALARDTYSAEKMGSEELTLDAVVGLARTHGLVTEEDVANLAPYGKRAGVVLYGLATTTIKQAGGAPLQELNRRVVSARQALANKNESTIKPKTPVKPVVPAAPGVKQPKIDEEDADVSGITSFMFP